MNPNALIVYNEHRKLVKGKRKAEFTDSYLPGRARFIWDDADPSILNALSTRDGNPHSGVERIIHDSPF